jgi:sedoheptulose-bisphosphatase
VLETRSTMAAAMVTLESELAASCIESRLSSVVLALASSCAKIAFMLRVAEGADTLGTRNKFGDEQLAADLRAHDILVNNLAATGNVATVSSEEIPVETTLSQCRAGPGSFSVAFDPVDGSSILSNNFAVGTIFGVWSGNKLVGQSGHSMVCAGCAVYGPRTTLYLAITGWPCAVELTLSPDFPSHAPDSTVPSTLWHVTRRVAQIVSGGKLKLFSPANIRATQDNPGYAHLINWYMTNRYTLRYTGGMVPDVCQLLVKGVGVYTSPVSDAAPAKLRLLYEALPMAFLVECAGGASSDGRGSLLERTVLSCHERTPVCLGSADEVARFAKHCPLR